MTDRGVGRGATTPANLDEIRRLEEGMWHPATRCDERWLDKHLHADFVEVGRSGRRHVRAGYFPVRTAPFEARLPLPDFDAREIRPRCVLTTYDSRVTYPDAVEHARRSSVWLRVDGRWQLVYHQGTPYEPASS